jgi:exonuclease SbcD
MKILHTSDWHLGRAFYGRKRYDEHEAFLKWLVGVARDEGVDALLVAGDIFDNGSPSNRAQELYYSFIRDMASSPCRHVVIIGGNHDSPSFLDAPKELLLILNVQVVSCADPNPSREVLLLDDSDGNPALIVCAIPYLRDGDVRTAGAGESIADKEALQARGIAEHYAEVEGRAAELAERLRNERPGGAGEIPVVVMGHLFAAGGVPGDRERTSYVGSLPHVPVSVFSQRVKPDYVALGHLHAPQTVGNDETVRYAGSPLPISFSEAGQSKFVNVVEFGGCGVRVKPIEAPLFRRIESVRGSWRSIRESIAALSCREGEPRARFGDIWMEVTYDGNDLQGDLRALVEREAEVFNLANCSGSRDDAGPKLDVLRVRDMSARCLPARLSSGEALRELDPVELFKRLLDAKDVPEERREGLIRAHGEVLLSLDDLDGRGDEG